MSAYKDSKQGTWYVIFRYTDWTGKKKQTMKRGFRTKKEALEYEKEFQYSVSADMDMLFERFVEVYFTDKKEELKGNSIRNKKHMIKKHLIPYFGRKRMNEITPADVIQWQNLIHEQNYSKTYERMIQNQLNALMNHAQRIYNLQNNPCKKVKRMGKSDADKLEFWTKAEYDKFISSIEVGSEDYLIFEILFWTGIREGELLALTPLDFDMSKKLLYITKTYHRIGGMDITDTPKTDSSVRVINIPDFLIREVEEYISNQYDFPKDERLFPIVARTLQVRFKRYQKKSHCKEIRVHDLRHSHVAYLIHQGVEPLIIKERLGHKDIKITLNTYGHLYPTKQKSVADMLNERHKDSCNLEGMMDEE
ncbi:hypothetical protein P261_01558 [Lachnospiraceae bacterium TWA4]|nr:hypothetical protein P261_01558 [Lachnospiraceae bacterium TWA4]